MSILDKFQLIGRGALVTGCSCGPAAEVVAAGRRLKSEAQNQK